MSHDHHHHDHAGHNHSSASASSPAPVMPTLTATTPLSVDHSSHHSSSDGGHHLMKMWFHGGVEEVILFDCWRTESFSGLALSCLLVFFMSAGYEALKWFRVRFELFTNCSGNGGNANGNGSRPKSSNNHHNNTMSVSLKGLAGSRHGGVGGGAEDALIEKSGAESPLQQQQETPTLSITPSSIPRQQSTEQIYAPTVVVSDSSGGGNNITAASANKKLFPLHSPKCQWLVNWLSSGGHSSFAPCRLIEAALYCVQLLLAYWLMLIAMTYNVYLTAAVVLGAGFGHWLFAGMKCAQATTLNQTDQFASDACH